jgi:hypothetical protein
MSDSQSSSKMKSLLRLAIGGSLLGYDELLRRMEIWNNQAVEQIEKAAALEEAGSSTALQTTIKPTGQLIEQNSTAPAMSILTPEQAGQPEQASRDRMRYAMVGIISETQEKLQGGLTILGKYTTAAGQLAAPLFNPLRNSRFAQPLERKFDRWVMRGEQEVNRWVEVGQREEVYSRNLAQAAFTETVDTGIDYLAANEQVQDLVTTQGVSLAGGMVEEVRERGVSADAFLEGIIRLMLRKPPRSELAPPSNKVMAQAAPLQVLREERLKQAHEQ